MSDNAQLTTIILTLNSLIQMMENLIGAGSGEGSVGNVKYKDSVVAATTANITLEDEQTIDTVAAVEGDRVLVKNQTDAEDNGLYVVVDGGPWTRATDADTWIKLYGSLVPVDGDGSVNGDAIFLCVINSGGTLNTTDVTWRQIAV